MRSPRWVQEGHTDDGTFRSTINFLVGRLDKPSTYNWAADLRPTAVGERLAVLWVLNSPEARSLPTLWSTRWRNLEEAWQDEDPQVEQSHSLLGYEARERVRSGERSGSLISAIVDLVRPRLHLLRSRDQLSWPTTSKRTRQPSYRLTSGALTSPSDLGLSDVLEVQFLLELAHGLDASLVKGLDVARRVLNWTESESIWRLGGLHRAYYVPEDARQSDSDEPDASHRGIAPTVKLLHAVVVRLSVLAPTIPREFFVRWELSESQVFTRLWASVARHPELASFSEVYAFLSRIDFRRFWSTDSFPEIAELRALRMSDLEPREQEAVYKRLLKGPPRAFYRGRLTSEQFRHFRSIAIGRELQRIRLHNRPLPPQVESALTDIAIRFPDLQPIQTVDADFSNAPRVVSRDNRDVADSGFSNLDGIELLRALETALGTPERFWDSNPRDDARRFIHDKARIPIVVRNLALHSSDTIAFPLTMDMVGWALQPESDPVRTNDANAPLAFAMLELANKINAKSLFESIDGLTRLLDSWAHPFKESVLFVPTWLRLWPHAERETNSSAPSVAEEELSASGHAVGENEPADLDTLNTPAGRLIGAFLTMLPSLQTVAEPFRSGPMRAMREALVSTPGRSSLIARYRLIESALPYFLRADPDWTKRELLAPLLRDDSQSIVLWRALGRRLQFKEVLLALGEAVIAKSLDAKIGRRTREALVFSLVVESLHALLESRPPAIAFTSVQQMLRRLDDGARAVGADTVTRFVSEMGKSTSPRNVFITAAKPFLASVWPQERSLASSGVSKAFADLPAASGDAFAMAVECLERFLVPFQAWSLLDYGLYGKEGDMQKIDAVIDSRDKAEALLTLLDATIGGAESVPVPHELDQALERIRELAPTKHSTPAFRRLDTLTRR